MDRKMPLRRNPLTGHPHAVDCSCGDCEVAPLTSNRKSIHCPQTRSGITCVNYPGPDCDCMAAKNLKPCPFCGGTELKLYRGGGKLYAQCQTCHACGPDHDDDRLHWDNRPEMN